MDDHYKTPVVLIPGFFFTPTYGGRIGKILTGVTRIRMFEKMVNQKTPITDNG